MRSPLAIALGCRLRRPGGSARPAKPARRRGDRRRGHEPASASGRRAVESVGMTARLPASPRRFAPAVAERARTGVDAQPGYGQVRGLAESRIACPARRAMKSSSLAAIRTAGAERTGSSPKHRATRAAVGAAELVGSSIRPGRRQRHRRHGACRPEGARRARPRRRPLVRPRGERRSSRLARQGTSCRCCPCERAAAYGAAAATGRSATPQRAQRPRRSASERRSVRV